MARRFDPARLFEAFRFSRHAMKRHPYPTVRAALEGGRTGRKPLSHYSVDVTGYGTLATMFDAFARGLVVTLWSRHPDLPLERCPIDMYASRAEELWRVPAMLTWSDALGLAPLHPTQDRYESLLLGYTPSQIDRWQRHLDSHDGDYVYTLLTHAQRARVVELGRRCFGSAAEITGATFFMDFQRVLKKNAKRLLPKELTLARTKCNPILLRALIGKPGQSKPRGRDPLVRVRLTKRQALAATRAMRSNVQLLTAEGWQ